MELDPISSVPVTDANAVQSSLISSLIVSSAQVSSEQSSSEPVYLSTSSLIDNGAGPSSTSLALPSGSSASHVASENMTSTPLFIVMTSTSISTQAIIESHLDEIMSSSTSSEPLVLPSATSLTVLTSSQPHVVVPVSSFSLSSSGTSTSSLTISTSTRDLLYDRPTSEAFVRSTAGLLVSSVAPVQSMSTQAEVIMSYHTSSVVHTTVTLFSSRPSTSNLRPSAPASSKTSLASSQTVSSRSTVINVPGGPESGVSASVSSSSSSIGNSGALADGQNGGVNSISGQTNLSSFAIVGIVGGILVAFVGAYLAWYKWRRNKTKRAAGSTDDISPSSPSFQKTYNAGNTVRSSFGDDVDPFDDPRTQYTAYHDARYRETRLQSDCEHDARESTCTASHEWDGYTQLLDDKGTRTQYLERGVDEDLEKELAGHPSVSMATHHQDVFREAKDPFQVTTLPFIAAEPRSRHPPSPTQQSLSRSLTRHSPQQRPSTNASDPFGFDRATKASMPVSIGAEHQTYDSVYEAYSQSRPETGHDHRATLQTPATAALVPWMRTHRAHGGADAEPRPPVPKSRQGHRGDPPRGGNASNVTDTIPRAAPAAVMAQTPVANGTGAGWTGVIPSFR
ncbi:hypothetical protein BD324DRAFT_622755 [Kockovaella imperatae]|uniref:Uncharacterized protein n=1 Tax=Kockovaella imperatae TaxID=4999 RepID=A0A1Y1UHV7_9TREE|nr:hypothetical protein BD324DRAFT_622755 [Kockovaella imperatae]ORX37653.1 hypothetical protein BD324DRAFT_622755 [Kockovaella imperatae]